VNAVYQALIEDGTTKSQPDESILPFMGIRHIPAVVAVCILLNLLAHCASAQSTAELRTWIEDKGSVPPVHQWFSCIKELDSEPYDKSKAPACLDSR
jgi:hypothetical protein